MERTLMKLYYSGVEKEINRNAKKELKIKQSKDFNKIDSNYFNYVIERELKLQENKNIFFPAKTRDLLKQISYYEYCNNELMINKYFHALNDKEKEIFLDIIY